MRIRESITRRLPLKVPVSPTFSGLRIADAERVPEPLRGRVIPWIQLRGLHNGIVYFVGDGGEPITHDGRRVNGVFEVERQTRVARRLLEREIRRRFKAERLEIEYRWRPEKLDWPMSILVWLGFALFVGSFATIAIGGAISLVDFFRGLPDFEPLSVRIMLGVIGAAAGLVWPVLFIVLVFAIRSDSRLRPREMRATSRGVVVTLPAERLEREWGDLTRVTSNCFIFSDQASVRLPRDERFHALGSVLRRSLPRQPRPSLGRLWLCIAGGAIILLLLVAIPIIVLMRAGYLSEADTHRMLLLLSVMFGMFLIPFAALSLLAARSGFGSPPDHAFRSLTHN